ncbi:MAG: hypothetical protein AAF961_10585 [Planctomycetota bacterium]
MNSYYAAARPQGRVYAAVMSLLCLALACPSADALTVDYVGDADDSGFSFRIEPLPSDGDAVAVDPSDLSDSGAYDLAPFPLDPPELQLCLDLSISLTLPGGPGADDLVISLEAATTDVGAVKTTGLPDNFPMQFSGQVELETFTLDGVPLDGLALDYGFSFEFEEHPNGGLLSAGTPIVTFDELLISGSPNSLGLLIAAVEQFAPNGGAAGASGQVALSIDGKIPEPSTAAIMGTLLALGGATRIRFDAKAKT